MNSIRMIPAVLVLACFFAPAPSAAAPPTNPGFKWTVTGHVGSGSSQAHDIYTSTDCQDAGYYVQMLQAFGFDAEDDFADVRNDLHITAVTVVGVLNLPQGWVQSPSEYDVMQMGQISLAFID